MENKELDFSVVICCYNPDLEKLKKTIISVVNQKDVTFEIIISDDGSKENYLTVLKTWIDENKIKNVRYNFLKNNVGTLKNLISGIEMSKGKYIKDISPGDYLFDQYSLKRYKKCFEEEGMNIIFSRAVFYTEDGRILKITVPKFKSSEKDKNLKKNVCLYRDYLLGSTMSYRREMIKYFYEIKDVVRLLEDYPFTYLALINNEKFSLLNENLVWYEYGTGISTSSNSNILDLEKIKFYEYLEKNYSDDKFVRKSLKFIRLLESTKFNKMKAYISKPSYLLKRIHSKIYNKFRKYPKIDYQKMQEITELKK